MRSFEVRFGLAVVTLSSLILFAWAGPRVATAAGPWKAQIVDAETKQPLEGVVVLAVWTRHVRSFGGPSSEYYDSQEVLTDKEGRFTIAPRSFFSLNPLVFYRGPRFLIFKPGHGRAVWPGGRKGEVWPEGSLESIVIAMARLRTLEERREYLKDVRSGFVTVPLDRTPLLEGAITEERRAVGYRS